MARSSGAERAYDDVGNRWWALPASASREERVQRGREAFISGGVRGGAMVGALGVCAHFLATFKCTCSCGGGCGPRDVVIATRTRLRERSLPGET